MPETLDDGFGMQVDKCGRADCDLQIVRPGKIQCGRCDTAKLFENEVLGTDERYAKVTVLLGPPITREQELAFYDDPLNKPKS